MRNLTYSSILLALAWILALGGCAETPVRPVHVNLPLLKLSPESFGGTVSLAQRLTFEPLKGKTERSRTIEALLEIDSDSVRLAGFALGQRILTLNWDGHVLDSKLHPDLPKTVDAERVLRDVEFVYWPATSIRAVLPQGWSLDDEAATRTLRHEGSPVLTVHYSAVPRWNARAELENAPEGYHLTIESSEQTQETQQ